MSEKDLLVKMKPALRWLCQRYKVPEIDLLLVEGIDTYVRGQGCTAGLFLKDAAKVAVAVEDPYQSILNKIGNRPTIVISEEGCDRLSSPLFSLFHEFHHYLDYLHNSEGASSLYPQLVEKEGLEVTVSALANEDLGIWNTVKGNQ